VDGPLGGIGVQNKSMNPVWQRIRSLIIKELLADWRGPKDRFVLLVRPVIQMLLFCVLL
jgi:hypothetical protein